MNRYLYRVQYFYPDADQPYSAYEPVCVRAETEAVAEAEVDSATERWRKFSGATKTLTLVLVVAEA